jgi:probable RNA-binding protein EIF1AD
MLPTKFHKLVWVKRNDYVIVQTGVVTEDEEKVDDDGNDEANTNQREEAEEGARHSKNKTANDESGIRYIICHILYKDQVKHLRSKGLWPENDPEFAESAPGGDNNDDNDQAVEDDDGIVYAADYDYEDDDDDNDNDDALFVNTNRIARLEIQESDDDDEDDSSSDEDD